MKHDAVIPGRQRGGIRSARAGFTLIELTVSLMVSSVLMVAIGASVVVASHAIPDGKDATSETVNSSQVIDQLAEELQYAKVIVENTDQAIEFTVQDRDGDLADEIIRYEWSGTIGDPLTRSYNSSDPVTIVKYVSLLDLRYVTKSYEVPVPPVESSEVQYHSNKGSSGANYQVRSNTGIGQFIDPPSTLPPEAVSWAVTRVQFKGKQGHAGSPGQTYVRIHHPTVDQRPDALIEQIVYPDNGLSQDKAQWFLVSFTDASGLLPDEGMCVVVLGVDAESSTNLKSAAPGSGELTTSDAGTTWSNNPSLGLLCEVYGTYSTGGGTTPAYALTRVDIKLFGHQDTGVTLHASANMLNLPEVASP